MGKPEWACAPIPKPKSEPKPARRGRVKPMSDQRKKDLKRRAEVLAEVEARDGYRCQGAVRGLGVRCGTVGERQDLEGHEIVPRGRDSTSWLNPDLVVLLCPRCHLYCTNPTGERLRRCRQLGLDVIAAPLPALPNFKETARARD